VSPARRGDTDSGGEEVEPRGRGEVRAFRYELPGGWVVLAGRSEADNDRLSLKVARPDDWWFHVRGMPGSHVVLQGPEGEEADRPTLERAAAVAAYHSKARTGGVVAVSCTRARFVRKPRGAKPGTVEIRKESVLKVRPQLPDSQDA
jgi:predicted ribosome quality control (RQC) complex YloA/Tae2 family protein